MKEQIDSAFERVVRDQALDLVEQHLQIERDHQLGFAVLGLEGQLFKRIERVEIDDDAARFEDRVIKDDERRGIRKKEPDLGALHDADLLQARRGAVNQFSDVGISQRSAQEGCARIVGAGRRRLIDEAQRAASASALNPKQPQRDSS